MISKLTGLSYTEDSVYINLYLQGGIDPQKSVMATINRINFNKKRLKSKYHYSDGTIIPDDVAQAIYWNRGKLTDYKNPNVTNLNVGGTTGYARRFINQKVI